MAALQIIALDTTTPQLRAPASGDTYAAPRAMEITPVSLTGSSATSSLSIAQTWNTTGTPTAIDLNVTDTASNAASLLMNLRVGGSSRFSLRKDGFIITTGSMTVGGNINLPGTANNLNWGGNIVLVGDAANTLAQRNGVNAQAFNIYNTYTDASNYERGFIRYSSNVLQIGHEGLGTGNNARSIEFRTQGFAAMTLSGAALTMNVALVFPNATRMNNNAFCAANNVPYGWSSSTNVQLAPDTTLVRVGAGLVGIRGTATTDGAAVSLIEQTAPAAPATNGVYIYAEDNGSGKTRLMALFATGAAQQIAIEP